MKNPIALVGMFLTVAILSATAGAAGSLMYLTGPFQKWQGEFSESQLPGQADALRQLRAGDTTKAAQYLETASSLALISLAERKDAGAKVPADARAAEAVAYLCSQPPVAASAPATGKLTFAEACVRLTRL